MRALKEKGLHYVGSGVSGGEDGARYGPSLMPGGAPEAWCVAHACGVRALKGGRLCVFVCVCVVWCGVCTLSGGCIPRQCG